MYMGVDIGGTKTFVAALDDAGVITEKVRFPTPRAYAEFVSKLKETAAALQTKNFRAGCAAVPGSIDRQRGIARRLGNLPWRDVPLQEDAEHIFACPILLEHDAALGGLSEAMLLPKDTKVLYITISTGIGTGFIDHQHIIPDLADSEGGQMLLEYHGKPTKWEDFASGRAIAARFGRQAVDITDEQTWRRIAHDLSIGFIELMAIAQPDIIVIGGGVGGYLDRFAPFLLHELQRYANPLVKIPQIRQAARPDDAVLYGCYDLAKAQYGQTA